MRDRLPAISVIMSTYNRKSFLSRSIESVLAQSFESFEFIIINNGSTDGSDQICEEYAKRDSRIKLFHIIQNNGAPAGRNKGLELASCDYVTIIDDDDYCEPQMLEFLLNLSNEHQADIAICGSVNDYNGKLEPYFVFEDLLVLNKVQGLDELLKREKYNVAPPAKLFRKELFKGINFKENVLVDDIHIIYKVFAKANTVAAKGVPLYRFTKHCGNMTSFIQTNKLSPDLLEEYLAAFHERTLFLSKAVPEITARAKYSEWSYMISMCDKIMKYDLSECMNVFNFMVRTLQEHYNEVVTCPFTTITEQELLQQYIASAPNQKI